MATVSESELSALFRREMAPFGRTHPIECPDSDKMGTPDCVCLLRRPHAPHDPGVGGVTAWVEFKHEPAWPKMPNTPLRLKRFTAAQLSFLTGWHAGGGRCAMLLQVKSYYLLLPPWHLRQVFEGRTQSELKMLGVVTSGVGFPTAYIMKWLTR